jgi:hypothetical protein
LGGASGVSSAPKPRLGQATRALRSINAGEWRFLLSSPEEKLDSLLLDKLSAPIWLAAQGVKTGFGNRGKSPGK